MPYIEVEKGIRVYVEDLDPGGGMPVLFIHGWPSNHRMFEYQFDRFPAYGYRCLGLDLRGFGQSDRPWDGYSYDRLADDVRAVVDALDVTRFILLGFSIGGAISIRYMARHAGHGVEKLALVSAAAPVFTTRPDYPHGLPPTEVNELLSLAYQDRPMMLAQFGSMFFNRYTSPEYMAWFTSLSLEASPQATIKCLVSLRDEDLRGDLAHIRVPTGIFAGVHDQVVPYTSAVALAQGIHGSGLYRFDNGGHGVYYDELDRFNASLLSFFRSPSPAP